MAFGGNGVPGATVRKLVAEEFTAGQEFVIARPLKGMVLNVHLTEQLTEKPSPVIPIRVLVSRSYNNIDLYTW